MKKVKLIAWISLSVIAMLVVLMWERPSAVIMLENNYPVMKLDCAGYKETLKAWYQEDGSCHFFLPAYAEDVEKVMLEGDAGKYSLQEEIFFAGAPVKIHVSSNLPAVFIDTKSGNNAVLDEDKELKEAGTVKIVSCEGEFLFKDEMDYITGRGNSTWNFDKKPYTLKLKNAVSLCGMKPGEKWVLLANAYEGTKISYKMVLDMAEHMGLEYTPEAEWVDLYMNGEYRGNYLLCKAIYIGSGSVDIAGGGILLEKDFPDYFEDEEHGFIINDGLTFSVKAPSDITGEEIKNIAEAFQEIDILLREGNKTCLDYLHTDSMINRFLIDELAYNSDTGITSTFFYKKPDSAQIMSGPVWDYDGSFGESNGEWLNYEGSVLDIKNSSRGYMYLDWVNLLYENDEDFHDAVVNRYQEIQPYLQGLLENGIDEYADYIRASVEMDMIRWDYGENTAGHYSSFENNVRFLKFFLAKRMSLLNTRWGLEQQEEPVLGNGEVHTVRFELDGNVYEEQVQDGDFLQNLPEIEGVVWRYSWDERRYSEFLPIFEDMTLVGEY